jgi:hypothetical protein
MGYKLLTKSSIMISRIISGGQTGADQAALDVAIELGIPYGGWIPKGRKTENGTLPYTYKLKEMATSSYARRTEQNVVNSDGTLIISRGPLAGGSELTQKTAMMHDRPCLYMDLGTVNVLQAVKGIRSWIVRHGIEILNVAGPRASEDPEIYDITAKILRAVLG